MGHFGDCRVNVGCPLGCLFPPTHGTARIGSSIFGVDPLISMKFHFTLSQTWKAHKVKLSFCCVIYEIMCYKVLTCQIVEVWMNTVCFESNHRMYVFLFLCYCFALFTVSGSNKDFIYHILSSKTITSLEQQNGPWIWIGRDITWELASPHYAAILSPPNSLRPSDTYTRH